MINKRQPLIDLHRHLDGNIRPSTIVDLADKHNLPLPANRVDDLLPYVQVQGITPDLLSFLQKLDVGVSVLADTSACYRVAYENMLDAQNEGLDYVELRFSPRYMGMTHKLIVADVVEAVIQGVQDGARDTGVKANLIGILSRTFGTQACLQELDGLLIHKSNICALDLAGDELGYPAEWFAAHFNQARQAGWQITVHAGEADGAKSIWNAIHKLGATRIGHGVAAAQDNTLMDYLASNKIAIESCLTSNLQTGTVSSLVEHPIEQFIEHGICVTLNTDDPGVSAIDLPHEYQLAHDALGLDKPTLEKIQLNALDAAFLSSSEKIELLKNVSEKS